MNPSGPDPGPDVDGPDHISAEEAQALAVPDSGLTIVTSRTLEAGGRSFKVHVHEYSGRPRVAVRCKPSTDLDVQTTSREPAVAVTTIVEPEPSTNGSEVTPKPAPPSSFLPAPEADSGMTPLQSVFTLCNSAIGAGVLSLPFAFKHAGLIGGLVLCAVIGSAEGFTLYVLSKFSERYRARSYGTLVRRTLGKKLMALLATIMVIYLFGSCVVYLIIIGDTFSALGGMYFGEGSFFASRNDIILTVGIVLLLPLCLLRKIGHLASLSAVAVAGFIYTAGVILTLGTMQMVDRWPDPLQGVDLVRWDMSALYALPIVVFGFNCHANVVSIFSELDDDAQPLISSLPPSPSSYRNMPAIIPRPKTTKMIGMISVIICAMAIIMTGYVLVGSAGYVGWPDASSGNVLNILPESNIFVQIAQGVIAFVVIGHFPLNHHPARSGMHDILTLMGIYRHPWWLSDTFTVLFVGGSVAVALEVTSLGDALHIIGGTAASFMIFFLPGLMLIHEAVMKESADQLAVIQQDPTKAGELNEPLLRQALAKGLKGMKHTGIVYSRRKSWIAGVGLVVFSLVVFGITIATVGT